MVLMGERPEEHGRTNFTPKLGEQAGNPTNRLSEEEKGFPRLDNVAPDQARGPVLELMGQKGPSQEDEDH